MNGALPVIIELDSRTPRQRRAGTVLIRTLAMLVALGGSTPPMGSDPDNHSEIVLLPNAIEGQSRIEPSPLAESGKSRIMPAHSLGAHDVPSRRLKAETNRHWLKFQNTRRPNTRP